MNDLITIKSQREIELLRVAGNVVYKTHQYLKPFIKEGVTTEELNRLGEEFIRSQGCTPSFKGYGGFPYALCISINSEVVHGFPSKRKLKKGDIVTLDIGACWKGYHGDSGWTYAVGEVDDLLFDRCSFELCGRVEVSFLCGSCFQILHLCLQDRSALAGFHVLEIQYLPGISVNDYCKACPKIASFNCHNVFSLFLRFVFYQIMPFNTNSEQ